MLDHLEIWRVMSGDLFVEFDGRFGHCLVEPWDGICIACIPQSIHSRRMFRLLGDDVVRGSRAALDILVGPFIRKSPASTEHTKPINHPFIASRSSWLS